MKKFLLFVLLAVTAVAMFGGEPQRGYRGFLYFDNSICRMTYYHHNDRAGVRNTDTEWFIGASTSHGFQFNRHIFAGAGVMVSTSMPSSFGFVPVFANFRYDGMFGRFAGFGDVRAGYYFGDEGGFYFSPTVGYRMSIGRKLGVNFGVGLTLRNRNDDWRETRVNYETLEQEIILHHSRKTDALCTLRIGMDF